jgi:hypothetical protein
MTRVSDFFYFFKNSTVVLTLFFHQEKSVPVYGVAPITDIHLLELFFKIEFFFRFHALIFGLL